MTENPNCNWKIFHGFHTNLNYT